MSAQRRNTKPLIIILLAAGSFLAVWYFSWSTWTFSLGRSDFGELTNTYLPNIETVYDSATCEKTSQCFGTTAEECVQNWLKQSHCLSGEYIDKHFSDFKAKKLQTYDTHDGVFTEYQVNFHATIDQVDVCDQSLSCVATVLMGTYNQISYFRGPLHEMNITISKREAENIMHKSSACRRAPAPRFILADGFVSTKYFYNAKPTANFPVPPQGSFSFSVTPQWLATDTTHHRKPYQYGYQCVVNADSGKLLLYINSNPAI